MIDLILKRLLPTSIPCFWEGLLLLPMTQWWVVEHIPAQLLWRIPRKWNKLLGGSKQHIFLLLIPKIHSLNVFIHSFLISVFLRLLKVLCKNAVSLMFTVNCLSLACEINWNKMSIVSLASVVLLHFVAHISNLLWVVILGLMALVTSVNWGTIHVLAFCFGLEKERQLAPFKCWRITQIFQVSGVPNTSLHVFGTTFHCPDPAFPISWDDLCYPVNCREGGRLSPLSCHREEAEAEAPVSWVGWAPWHVCWLLIFRQFSFGEDDLHETVCELLHGSVWERQTRVFRRTEPGVF